MIDIKLIRENPKLVKENIKKKFQLEKLPLVDKILDLDSQWRKLKYKTDHLRSQRNKISEKINKAKKSKSELEANKLIEQAKEIPKKIESLENQTKNLKKEIKAILLKIPNIIHKSVPLGKDDSQNKEIKKIGKPKKPSFKILNHVELAEKLEGVDFDSAREVSGKGFYYLKGQLAILSAAMTSFARDYMISQNFEYIEPPLMIRNKIVEGVMSFEEKENMMYKIENEDLYLIGTSEHSLIGMYIDKILLSKQLPQTITGFSPCFRKEVGAHGIEEKGFYRVHQFKKQEMIVICEPKESYQWYEKMLKYTLKVFKELNIPTRVLECCSGDLADLKSKSCDVEAWSPRQKKYYEVGSLTNTEEAQARRLNIKINNGKERYFPHILNNTVLATPRALIALMENNQTKQSTIKIPKALWKYTGFKEIKPKEKIPKTKKK